MLYLKIVILPIMVCLARYCECFASGIYCDGCNCVNCYNNADNDAARQEAIGLTLERNPNAFRPKIDRGGHVDSPFRPTARGTCRSPLAPATPTTPLIYNDSPL